VAKIAKRFFAGTRFFNELSGRVAAPNGGYFHE
jgi:hypothetical protein